MSHVVTRKFRIVEHDARVLFHKQIGEIGEKDAHKFIFEDPSKIERIDHMSEIQQAALFLVETDAALSCSMRCGLTITKEM